MLLKNILIFICFCKDFYWVTVSVNHAQIIFSLDNLFGAFKLAQVQDA